MDIKDIKFDFGFKEGRYLANAWTLADKNNECVYCERWHMCEEEFKKGKWNKVKNVNEKWEKFKKSRDYKLLVSEFKKRALKAMKEKVKEFLK